MAEETEGTRLLRGDQRKGIIAMAIPIGVALLFQQLNNIIDSLWMSDLGGDALAAIGIVYPIFKALTGIGIGLGIGVSASIARSIGRGDHDTANRSAASGVVLAFMFSLFMVPILLITAEPCMSLLGAGDAMEECLDYATPLYVSSFFIVLSGVMSGMLRGEGAAKRSMEIQVLGVIVNMILDPIFIFGLGMGVQGAAWATVIAFVSSSVLAGYWYAKGKNMYVDMSRSDFKPNKTVFKDVLSVGGPQSLELAVTYLFNLFVYAMVISCCGTDMLGLFGSSWRLVSMLLIITQAMSSAMVAVCSAKIGMGRYDQVKDAFRYTVTVTFAVTVVMAIIQVLAADLISTAYTHSDDLTYLHDDMKVMLYYFSLFLPVMSFVYTGSALLQALKKSSGAMVNSLCRNILYCGSSWVAATFVGTMSSILWAVVLTQFIGGIAMLLQAVIGLRRTMPGAATAERIE